MTALHIPVLRDEVIHGLNVQTGKKFVDATVGYGGHGVEILRQGGTLLGIDTDPTAVKHTTERLKRAGHAGWTIVQGNFRTIASLAREHGFENADGVLFDLGVSSVQLDTPERGFSYRFTDAPLDLRMDQTRGETAAQLVNRASEQELYDIFSRYGEEQLAGSIARALYRANRIKQCESVGDVTRVIQEVVRDQQQQFGVMSRIFQSLRIAVNDELDSVRSGLDGAQTILKSGGRLVVISFHSLEDRIVKRFMQNSAWQVLTKHPVTAAKEEIMTNPRSRSAKLRVAQKR